MTSSLPPLPVDFYFDYLSPYAYFGWMQLREAAQADGFDLRPIPVVFAKLLDAHGQLGPAEIPAKALFVLRDNLRFAKRHGIPFTLPGKHPFRSIEALRLSLAEVAGNDQIAVIDALWKAGWQHGLDLGDSGVLRDVLNEAGLHGAKLLERTQLPEAKATLRKNTEQAVGRGVFGVPTFGVGDEVVWGNDRLDDVRDLAKGKTLFTEDEVHALMTRPAGARRATDPLRNAGPRGDAKGQPANALTSSSAERIQAVFDRAPFIRWLGVRVISLKPGAVETELTLAPDQLQQNGFGHAGVVATLADHTAGAAAATTMGDGQIPLTIEFTINLLRPAIGPLLTCKSTVLRAGRNVTVSEAEVFSCAKAGGEKKLVAKAMTSVAVVSREELTKR